MSVHCIFLRVMSTISDTVSACRDLSFSLAQSPISINHSLYVDDVCVISSSPAGCLIWSSTIYGPFKRFPALIPGLRTKRPPSLDQAISGPLLSHHVSARYSPPEVRSPQEVFKYFGTSLQMAFLPNIPGYTEHQLKLLKEAQVKHRALAVC